MMAGHIEFEVPLPPRGLSPNLNGSKAHWARIMEARSEYRGTVKLLGVSQRNRTPGWTPPFLARVSLRFGIARGPLRSDGFYRPIDLGNAVAAFKAGFDGLVDAGLLREDHAEAMELGRVTISREHGPGVLVRVEGLE